MWNPYIPFSMQYNEACFLIGVLDQVIYDLKHGKSTLAPGYDLARVVAIHERLESASSLGADATTDVE